MTTTPRTPDRPHPIKENAMTPKPKPSAAQRMRDRNTTRKLQGWALIVVAVVLVLLPGGQVNPLSVALLLGGIALLVVAALRRPPEVDPPVTD